MPFLQQESNATMIQCSLVPPQPLFSLFLKTLRNCHTKRWDLQYANHRPVQKSSIKKQCKCPTNLWYWDKVLSLTASASEPFFNALKAQEHFITPQNNTVFYVRKRCSGNLPWKLPANIHFLAALCIWRGLLFSF